MYNNVLKHLLKAVRIEMNKQTNKQNKTEMKKKKIEKFITVNACTMCRNTYTYLIQFKIPLEMYFVLITTENKNNKKKILYEFKLLGG